MITGDILVELGHIGKPHGLNGELNLYTDIDIDLTKLSCIVLNMDGINVPFFFKSVRTRGAESFLVMIDGIENDYDASKLANKIVYGLIKDVPEVVHNNEDGFYAEDLIGFKTIINGGKLYGEVLDIDDMTQNVLFIVKTDEGKLIYIPVADEFIDEIDVDNKMVKLVVPDGILEL